MRGTRDQRWAAVYGAAYVEAYSNGFPDCAKYAARAADAAIAAEPEEAETPSRFGCISARLVPVDDDTPIGQQEAAYVADDRQCTIRVFRSEAAALARLLARFAETGEI